MVQSHKRFEQPTYLSSFLPVRKTIEIRPTEILESRHIQSLLLLAHFFEFTLEIFDLIP